MSRARRVLRADAERRWPSGAPQGVRESRRHELAAGARPRPRTRGPPRSLAAPPLARHPVLGVGRHHLREPPDVAAGARGDEARRPHGPTCARGVFHNLRDTAGPRRCPRPTATVKLLVTRCRVAGLRGMRADPATRRARGAGGVAPGRISCWSRWEGRTSASGTRWPARKRLHKLRCRPEDGDVRAASRATEARPPVSDEHDDDVFAGFSRTAGAHKSATDRTSPRLLTGSLDGHVKVHELDGFSVTHSAKYPGPVLSVALSPDAQVLAVGTANRLLSIRRRSRGSRRGVANRGGRSWRSASGGEERRSGGGGAELGNPGAPPPGRGAVAVLRARAKRARAAGDARVERRRRARLAPHDHALRRFRYGEALDAALAGGRAEVVAAVIEEIGRRGGLKTALAGRDAAGLGPVLRSSPGTSPTRGTRGSSRGSRRGCWTYTAAK